MREPLLQATARRGRERRGLPCSADETVLEWLERHGQGPRLRALLWEPLALAALNQRIDRAAAPTFVRVLGRVFGPGRTDASVVLPTTPLVDLFGAPARAYLEGRGARVQMDALAASIVDGAQVRGRASAGPCQPARRVVLATPWHTWPRTLTGDVSPIGGHDWRLPARPRPSSIVTVTLAYDRPVLSTSMLGFPGRAMQWAFDTAALGGAEPGGARGPRVLWRGAVVAAVRTRTLARLAHEVLTSARGRGPPRDACCGRRA